MRRFLYAIVTLVVALLAADFAVSNRAVVSFAFWPLQSRIDCPLYLAVLPALIVGFLFGRVLGWWGNVRIRRDRKRQARKIAQLEAELRQAAPVVPTGHEAASARAAEALGPEKRSALLMSAH